MTNWTLTSDEAVHVLETVPSEHRRKLHDIAVRNLQAWHSPADKITSEDILCEVTNLVRFSDWQSLVHEN